MKQMDKKTTKQLSILALFSVVSTVCWGQIPDYIPKPKEKKTNAKPKPETPQFQVRFQANHDFYLAVDKEKYDKTPKDKPTATIRLRPGVHSLFFEEADSTGQTIERYFKVTKEMIKHRDSTYTVTFEKDFTDIIQLNAAVQPNQNKPKQR